MNDYSSLTVHDVAEAGGILCVVAGDGNSGELDLTGIDDEELDKVCYCCCCCCCCLP